MHVGWRHGVRWRSRWLAGLVILSGMLLGLALGLFGAPAETADAAVLTVTTNAGGAPAADGFCSLREAIQNARNNALTHGDCLVAGAAAPAVDEIHFNIGGGGPQSIFLTSPLDTLTGGPLLLDATTQPGPGALPLVTLDGVGTGANVSGFQALGADVTIRGFAIVRFAQNGILINAGAQRTVIQGNHIGIDRLGQTAQPNATGISLVSAFTTTIGGTDASQRNVISGNTGDGIVLSGSNTSTIQGNFIGTNGAGTSAVPNRGNGILAGPTAFSALIGGTASGAGNVISGNGINGIFGQGDNVRMTIQGNRIGTSADGLARIPNIENGIRLDTARTPLIGGTDPGAGNLISANGVNGVRLLDDTNATIQGNIIGTDINGNGFIAPRQIGISFENARGTVGGATVAARNIITGNSVGILTDAQSSNVGIRGNYFGLRPDGSESNIGSNEAIAMSGTNHGIGGNTPAEGNVFANAGTALLFIGAQLVDVRNNRIGTTADGAFSLGVDNGIAVNNSHRMNIGDPSTPGRGNVIGFTSHIGIAVSADSDRIGIFGNSMFRDQQQGINLGGPGSDANDPGDADAGANTLQNFPVIITASTGTTTAVGGTLNTTPNTAGIRIQIYGSPACHSTGFGEGQTFLGEVTVSTDGGGNVSWSATGLPAVAVGSVITTTATSPSGSSYNTSEFSACKTVAAAGSGPIAVSPTQVVTTEAGGTGNFTVVLSSQPAANVTIPVSSSDTTEGTVSVAQLVFTPQNWNVPQAVTVTGVDDTLIDGPIAYTIVLGAAVSADPAFSGVDPADVGATNQDNDTSPSPAPPSPNNDGQSDSGKPKNERADEVRETGTGRQQRERTNRSGSDDYRTEGNVVAVDFDASPRTATIATRDGLQVIVLLCRDSCDDPHVGDYLEADGVKENEALFYADSVTSRRPGRR